MKSDAPNKVVRDSDTTLESEDIVRYLKQNPDFFTHQEELLYSLKIPHQSGTAISLLERQVILLRERNEELNRQIHEFINNANANDTLFEKTRIVLLELLKASTLEELSEALTREITSRFSAIESSLLFITDEQIPVLDCRTLQDTTRILGTLFEKKRTFCGTLKTGQNRFLFPDSADRIVSTAVVPVHISSEEGKQHIFNAIPLLVIGSDIPNYFNNNQDTLFLDFIGEVLSALILHLR